MNGLLHAVDLARAVVPPDDHARAHGQAVEKANEQVDEAAGRADGGQGLAAQKVAYDQRVHCVVELLEQIAQQQRHGERDELAGDGAFCHQRGTLDRHAAHGLLSFVIICLSIIRLFQTGFNRLGQKKAARQAKDVSRLFRQKVVDSPVEILGLFVRGVAQLLVHEYPAAELSRDFLGRLRTDHTILPAADDEHRALNLLKLLVGVAGQACPCCSLTWYIMNVLPLPVR